MHILLRSLTALFTAVFAGGLFLTGATSGATAAQEDRAVIAKRQDGVSDLTTVDDDDDDARTGRTAARRTTPTTPGAGPAAAGAVGTTPTAASRT